MRVWRNWRDALVLEASDRKIVQVRFLLLAPFALSVEGEKYVYCDSY